MDPKYIYLTEVDGRKAVSRRGTGGQESRGKKGKSCQQV